MAFFFVHWLTDLAGAIPTPLKGCEKFVSNFPVALLAGFVRSFPIVQSLTDTPPTAVYQRFLTEWWPDALGPPPTGERAGYTHEKMQLH